MSSRTTLAVFSLMLPFAVASNSFAHHKPNHKPTPPSPVYVAPVVSEPEVFAPPAAPQSPVYVAPPPPPPAPVYVAPVAPAPTVVVAPTAPVGGLGAGGLGGAGLVAAGVGAAALVGIAVVGLDDDDATGIDIAVDDQTCKVTITSIRNIKKISINSDDGSSTDTTNYSGRVNEVILDGVWNDYSSSSIFVNTRKNGLGELVVPDVPPSCECGIGDGTPEQILQAALDNTVLATVEVVGDGNISCDATNLEFDFTYKSSPDDAPVQRGGNLLSVYYNLIPGDTQTKEMCFAVLCSSQ